MKTNSCLAGPQRNAHPHFEPRYRRGLDPRRTTKERGDHRVRDTGLASHRAQALLANGCAQVRRDQAHDLGHRVSAGSVLPVIGAGPRGISFRPWHQITVGQESAPVAGIDCRFVSTLRSTASTGHKYDHLVNGEGVKACNAFIPIHPPTAGATLTDVATVPVVAVSSQVSITIVGAVL